MLTDSHPLPPYIDGLEPFERSFDFSESPNLQKVHFGLCWIYGDLRWISIALSTLKPTTSPRLSSISLYFSSTSSPRSLHHVSGTTKLEILGNDLRRVADELSRIEREYEGVVDLIVSRDAGFKRVDTRNVRFHFCGAGGLVESFSFGFTGPPALGSLKCHTCW